MFADRLLGEAGACGRGGGGFAVLFLAVLLCCIIFLRPSTFLLDTGVGWDCLPDDDGPPNRDDDLVGDLTEPSSSGSVLSSAAEEDAAIARTCLRPTLPADLGPGGGV